MKSKYFIFILVFFCTHYLTSQTRIDYFKNVIDTTSNVQLKLASIDSLIFLHEKANELETLANYVEDFVDLAIENKEYKKAIEVTISTFHIINIKLGHREQALKNIEKVEPYIDQVDDPYFKGGIYLKKGGGYFNGKSFQKAIEYYSKAIDIYSNKDSIYKADAIYFRGQANFEVGNYLKSINDYKLAATYYENLGDKDYTFYTLGSIISIYSVMGFVEKAIEEREKFIDKKIKSNFRYGLTVDYYNHSLAYKKLANKEKQLEYLMKSLGESKKDKGYKNLPALYSALSKYHADTDLQKSKEYLDAAKKVVEAKEKNTFDYQHYTIANAYHLSKSGKENRAIDLYLATLKEAKETNKSSMILTIQNHLSEIYESKKDYKKAFQFKKAHTKLKDSIFNRTKTNALAYYQTLYETEKKESEIKQQQSDIEILASENQSKKRLIIFGGIGLFLTFLLILLFRNREHFKKKNELQRQFAQNLLLSQDLERKRISKDLHDSLGQSLLLVKATINPDNSEAKNRLNETIDEMRNISRILYPLQLKELGITSAIENLLKQLDENYPDTYIFGDIENIDGILSTEHELNLFRIVQECLSNVIKHAKAQSAKLELQREGNQIILTLQDNGIGFDFLSKFKNLKSLGLKTIKERARFINGILRVESNLGNGSKFKVVIQTS